MTEKRKNKEHNIFSFTYSFSVFVGDLPEGHLNFFSTFTVAEFVKGKNDEQQSHRRCCSGAPGLSRHQ